MDARLSIVASRRASAWVVRAGRANRTHRRGVKGLSASRLQPEHHNRCNRENRENMSLWTGFTELHPFGTRFAEGTIERSGSPKGPGEWEGPAKGVEKTVLTSSNRVLTESSTNG